MKSMYLSRPALLRGMLAAVVALSLNQAVAAAKQPDVSSASTGATKHLPRILVLTTGGTIASTADSRSVIGYNAGGVTGDQLVASVPGLGKLASIKAEQISNIGSQDMSSKIWYELAARIKQVFDRNEADGVVITHGTDTMEETGFFLSNVLSSSKPVVLVGSMRPSDANSADGPNNLYDAVEVAASSKSVNRGVLIVMNDTIHSPRWATKTDTTAVQTFRDPNAGPLGYVDPASIRYLSAAPSGEKHVLHLPDGGLPREEIVYAHVDMDAQQIDEAVRNKAKGIVVVRSTRVSSGFVNRNVEVSDDKNGFVTSYDLNPQKARVLTQLLIGNGITAPEPVQKAFSATY